MWGRDTFIKSITGQVQTGTGVRAWDQDSAVISAREVLCLNMLAQLELLDGDEAQKQGSQVTLELRTREKFPWTRRETEM